MGNLKAVEEARMGANETPVVFKAAAATLTLDEQVVVCTVSSGTGSYSLTLPAVASAQGLTFTVKVIRSANALTLQDQDDSEDWSDLTLDADEDHVTLYSDGIRWSVIENGIA